MTRTVPRDLVAEARRQWAAHGWPDAGDGVAVVTSVMRVQQILLARIDRVLRPLDLTFARYELLMLLHFSRDGRLPMSVVSSRLQVHPTSVTSAVDRLETAGLVSREAHPRDRRSTLVALTAEGRRLALHATAVLNAGVFEDLGLTRAQSRDLVAGLTTLRERAGDL